MPRFWFSRLFSLLLGFEVLFGFNQSMVVFSLTLRSMMRIGEMLNVNESLVSPKAKFELGFVSQDLTTSSSSSSYVLAISYKNLSQQKTIVWEAVSMKPNTVVWEPIMSSPIKNFTLSLSQSGDLILMDSDSPLWRSNTADMGVDMATLLDNGNLVLMAKNETIWESFQHPTDTLLPTQSLNLSFVSPLSTSDGNFVFYISDVSIYLIYTAGPYAPPYWISQPSNTNSTVNEVFFEEDGTFGFHSTNQSSLDYHIPIDYGVGPLRRIRLDPDGNMRMYSLDSNSNNWVIVWQAVLLECVIDGRCGSYGICVYMPQPKCICPLGFSPISANDPSHGCAPNMEINCTTATIVSLERVDYQWGDIYPNTGGDARVSASECIKRCLANCQCLGATYKLNTGICWLKNSIRTGYQSFDNMNNLFFLKVSSLDDSLPKQSVPKDLLKSNFTRAAYTLLPLSSSSQEQIKKYMHINSTYKISTYVLSCVGSLELLSLLVALYFFWAQRSRHLSIKAQLASLEEMTGAPSSFSFSQLVAATANFSKCLGTGAFASVYKGVINKAGVHVEVAVKKLEYAAKGSETHFRTEVMTIGKVHHVNLVRLYGFCSQPSYRLLVYECMPNGSLDRFLFGRKDGTLVLDWETRLTIAVGTARGIAYLHEGCRECILHCDIKPQNILLDAHFQPKVSDFGLAKLIDKDRLPPSQRDNMSISGVPMTIRGTPGYMAPEWMTNQFSHDINEKVDVYSFGIVLLELVAGRQNCFFIASAMTTNQWHMPTWARFKLDTSLVLDIIDPNLQLVEQDDLIKVEKLIEVAILCIDYDPLMRPSMTKVVQMLEDSLGAPNRPSEAPLEITRSDLELTQVQSIPIQLQDGTKITSHLDSYPFYPSIPSYIGNSCSTSEPSSSSYASEFRAQ